MIEKDTWIIVSKCRKVIAAGNPRDRKLVKVADSANERILTYNSKGKAESAFKRHGFYPKYKDHYTDPDVELEAVKVRIVYMEVGNE
ncbi:hypothetical protein HWD03_gp057 [Alteromonas phage vB_AmeM_PT11-V22]|uniref:Uncharacterized protein n=1 Tax=Alteromonas phage vB_AmeM_PT11-V22 TaxID=2704031 RepID=A0A6C0R1Y1_9CAUD|nr:hypothetical protein HWD03_gp057 [Alteromonas phage vB_AmeM_PT11-V22]QHZ59817.1 hypothetical protein [Alteromonas phage vB_AmeM_PT11-V22]